LRGHGTLRHKTGAQEKVGELKEMTELALEAKADKENTPRKQPKSRPSPKSEEEAEQEQENNKKQPISTDEKENSKILAKLARQIVQRRKESGPLKLDHGLR